MTNITTECQAGYDAHDLYSTRDGAPKNPHLFSSPSWLAYCAGEQMFFKGVSRPTKAKMSRGFSVRIETNDNKFLFKASGADLEIQDLERL